MKSYRDAMGRPIMIITMFLLAVGVVAVLSASASTGASDAGCGYNSLYFFGRQLLAITCGLCGLFWMRHIDLDKCRNFLGVPTMLASVALSLVALACPAQNGAHRWINLGPINFQVGELAKLACVCFWALFLTKHRDELGRNISDPDVSKPIWKRWINELKEEVWPLLSAIGLTAILLLVIELGHDLGTLVLIVATIAGMVYVAGLSMRSVLRVLACIVPIAAMLIFGMSYRVSRITSWIDPLANYDKVGGGYQAVNSFVAIASGGLWGRGVPFSGQKYGFLPEQHTDFIYAVICEEIGTVGTFGILTLFGLLVYCGFKLASRCKDPYRSLLAFGITFQLGLQVLINVGVVTGVLPNKGLPLPFISYGGSSVVITLISIGLLLNISDSSRQSGVVKRKERRPAKRVVRAISLSSSSSETNIAPISSGEWRAVVRAHDVHEEPNLPHPKVDSGWSRVVNIKRAPSREQRERLRRIRKA